MKPQAIPQLHAQSEIAPSPYGGVIEAKYTHDNPEITIWTRKFQDHVEALGIFSAYEKAAPVSAERSEVVSTLWHGFSEFMPWFLCQAAAKMSTNERRHYVIQTAFEELGMRDVREIHADMFRVSTRLAGVTDSRFEQIKAQKDSGAPLARLREFLLSYQTDEEVLGILLGLEIPAIENIETLFRSLAHTTGLEEKLARDRFFSLHRQIEVEHVRLTTSNFLRFCTSQEQKDRFLVGFRDGLEFWNLFWSNAARIQRLQTGV